MENKEGADAELEQNRHWLEVKSLVWWRGTEIKTIQIWWVEEEEVEEVCSHFKSQSKFLWNLPGSSHTPILAQSENNSTSCVTTESNITQLYYCYHYYYDYYC